MAAAKDVFAAKGYEGASVADIAAEAGYTKGAVYAAFPSKKTLKEIGVTVEKLLKMGYEHDCYGNPIESEEQIIELKVPIL